MVDRARAYDGGWIPVPGTARCLPAEQDVDVALGVLDDDPGIRVPHHIFVASKAPWVEITDGLPQYPESSPKVG